MFVQRYTAGIKSSMAFLFVLLTHTHTQLKGPKAVTENDGKKTSGSVSVRMKPTGT